MSIPLLTAVTDAAVEADLLSAIASGDLGVVVVRRCVDLADLLAAATAGTARAAVLSADLRRLDRDALTRLHAAGVAVVGLHAAGDDDAARRLRQLGVATVLPADSGVTAIASAVQRAVAGEREADRDAALRRALSDPGAALDAADESPDEGQQSADAGPAGRVVAVWGPAGAPGRTTVAVTLAAELADAGVPVLLVDADVYGGVIAQVLGLLDDAPGLPAAARRAAAGRLDVDGLAALAVEVAPRLRLLSGLARAERWPELRPADVAQVLSLGARLARVVIVDCGFCLEQDEELAYDTLAPRRNGVTLEVLAQAETVLAVGRGDPVGLHRLIRGLSELRELAPATPVRVVVNRVRKEAVPGDPRREVAAALARHAGVNDPVLLPDDAVAVDRATARGATLREVAAGSPVRVALRDLVVELGGVPGGAGRRGAHRRAGLRRTA